MDNVEHWRETHVRSPRRKEHAERRPIIRDDDQCLVVAWFVSVHEAVTMGIMSLVFVAGITGDFSLPSQKTPQLGTANFRFRLPSGTL